MCQHHIYAPDDWAAGNKIICDLLHRGKILPRLPLALREDPPVDTTPEAEAAQAWA
jgi:hypothetical protein